MKVKDAAMQAFPFIEPADDPAIQAFHPGMTLKDYFAAHAPEPPSAWRGGDKGLGDIIAWRWFYAEAMMNAREAK